MQAQTAAVRSAQLARSPAEASKAAVHTCRGLPTVASLTPDARPGTVEPCTPTCWTPGHPSCPCARPHTARSARGHLVAAAGGRRGLVVVVPAVVLLLLVGTAWTVGLLAVTVAAGAAYVVAVPPWLYRISRWEVTDHAVYTCTAGSSANGESRRSRGCRPSIPSAARCSSCSGWPTSP